MINNTTTSQDPESLKLENEIKDYTVRLNFLRNEATRVEGVIMYLQNQLQEKAKK